MSPKSGRKHQHLRRVIRKHGEASSAVVAGHLYSVHEKIKWAREHGWIERRSAGKGKSRYRLSDAGRYEFYYWFGHEKSWKQMAPAQRARAARIIIEGALAKYGPYNKLKSIAQTVHHPLNQTVAGLVLLDLVRLQNQLRNMQRLFHAEHHDTKQSSILSNDIRRVKNSIGIFQAVFDGLQHGTYTLER